MGDSLNNITSEWNEAYDLLYEKINNNLTNFKKIQLMSLTHFFKFIML